MKLLGSSKYFSNKNNQINKNKWKYGRKSNNKKILSDPYDNHFQKYLKNVEKVEEEVEIKVEDKVVR